MEILTSPLVILWVLPLVINYFLAKHRGKNVLLMLTLTLVFSWLITISLACNQLIERRYSPELAGNTCPLCHRQYRAEDTSCFICNLEGELVEHPVAVRHGKVCKKCGRHNRNSDVFCFNCKALLPRES